MKNELNIKVILVLCLALFMGACTKNFEEFNTNPNSPSVVPTTNHFGGVLVNFNNSFMSPGFSSVMQHPNHVGSRLSVGTSTYSSIGQEWGDYYRALTNINKIIAESEELGNTNMQAAALTFRAQMTQVVTDMWRDMPYTEASKASEGNIIPAYDNQEDIYPLIIADLKKAADLFNSGGTDELGEGDVLLGGDIALWQKFCNSLRLRVAIRISNVDLSTATGIINEVLGNPTNYPVLESNADNVELEWPGTPPWEESFWYWWYVCHHEGAGKIIVDIMNNLNDPRMPIWFVPATTDGVYRGSERVGFTTEFLREDISDFNETFVNGTGGPDGYFRYSEICLLKAEIYQRDIMTGDAQAEYEKGIEASMTQYGVSAADIPTYLANSGVAWEDNDDDLNKIYTQKYLALFLMPQEAWAEGRRTDVPVFPVASGSIYTGHNRAPFRLPYPQSEQALNSKNVQPFLGNVVDFHWGQQMWWDTRTGVN